MVFTTPPQTAGEQYALAACLGVLATVMVGLRFYAMRGHKISFGHDDAWIIVALIFTWATAIDNILGAALGLEGQHTELSPQGAPILTPRYVVFLKTIYVNQITQVLAVGPTKLSVLFFYRRIFTFSGRWFNIASWAMIGLVVAWSITFVFANLLECIPISQAWVSQVGGSGNPHCIDAIPMYLAQQYFDVIMDGIILVMPLPLIWRLQMRTRRKIGLLMVFGVGILTIAASCAKLVVMEFVGTEVSQHTADMSYFLTPMMYWPMIEASLGITAACMPKIPSLFLGDGSLNVLFSRISSRISSFALFSSAGGTTTSRSQSTAWPKQQTSGDSFSKTMEEKDDNITKDHYWGTVNEAYTGQGDSDSLWEHSRMEVADEENAIVVKRVYGTTVRSING